MHIRAVSLSWTPPLLSNGSGTQGPGENVEESIPCFSQDKDVLPGIEEPVMKTNATRTHMEGKRVLSRYDFGWTWLFHELCYFSHEADIAIILLEQHPGSTGTA